MKWLVLLLTLAACASSPEDCKTQCDATSHQLGRPLHATWALEHPPGEEWATWSVCRCEEANAGS